MNAPCFSVAGACQVLCNGDTATSLRSLDRSMPPCALGFEGWFLPPVVVRSWLATSFGIFALLFFAVAPSAAAAAAAAWCFYWGCGGCCCYIAAGAAATAAGDYLLVA